MEDYLKRSRRKEQNLDTVVQSRTIQSSKIPARERERAIVNGDRSSSVSVGFDATFLFRKFDIAVVVVVVIFIIMHVVRLSLIHI